MSYATIDSTIKAWVTMHNLTLFTVYQDYEVRSVDVVNQLGHRCQIWIDEPDGRGQVGVHAWDYRKKKKDYSVQISELPKCLEEAYKWCQGV